MEMPDSFPPLGLLTVLAGGRDSSPSSFSLVNTCITYQLENPDEVVFFFF